MILPKSATNDEVVNNIKMNKVSDFLIDMPINKTGKKTFFNVTADDD